MQIFYAEAMQEAKVPVVTYFPQIHSCMVSVST